MNLRCRGVQRIETCSRPHKGLVPGHPLVEPEKHRSSIVSEGTHRTARDQLDDSLAILPLGGFRTRNCEALDHVIPRVYVLSSSSPKPPKPGFIWVDLFRKNDSAWLIGIIKDQRGAVVGQTAFTQAIVARAGGWPVWGSFWPGPTGSGGKMFTLLHIGIEKALHIGGYESRVCMCLHI